MKQFKKLLFVCYFPFCGMMVSIPLFASFEYQGIDWAAASANIRVVGDKDLGRFLLNPALMQGVVTPALGIQYAYPFAGLKLKAGSLAAGYQLGKYPMVSGLHFFGDDVYSEVMLNTGTSFSLSHEFQIGMNLNLAHLGIKNTYAASTASVSICMSLKLSDDIQIASVVEHILQSRGSLTRPQRFHLGAEYNSGFLNVLFDVEKEAALPLELAVALLTSSMRKWQLAVGYRDLSQAFSAGWRLKIGNLSLHYSAVLHPVLPVSHGFGLELSFP